MRSCRSSKIMQSSRQRLVPHHLLSAEGNHSPCLITHSASENPSREQRAAVQNPSPYQDWAPGLLQVLLGSLPTAQRAGASAEHTDGPGSSELACNAMALPQ